MAISRCLVVPGNLRHLLVKPSQVVRYAGISYQWLYLDQAYLEYASTLLVADVYCRHSDTFRLHKITGCPRARFRRPLLLTATRGACTEEDVEDVQEALMIMNISLITRWLGTVNKTLAGHCDQKMDCPSGLYRRQTRKCNVPALYPSVNVHADWTILS
jgi:hypothetical protein